MNWNRYLSILNIPSHIKKTDLSISLFYMRNWLDYKVITLSELFII